MDRFSIRSKLLKRFITKTIRKIVKRKFGSTLDVYTNDFDLTINDDVVKAHIDVDLSMSTSDLENFLNSLDL